ncbi:GDNF receptor alpha-2 [Saguinus oedipus]|uniref:GDNF family receptor alpha-2 n=1 Tax=Saguinus oedipus TaxID=9490 RepID=A0ABQ9U9N7_SAGOE|nr:GDNF receptor alpha-2 [Saguinus oedipus]
MYSPFMLLFLFQPVGLETFERPHGWSRLADFHANCRASYHTVTSCPADNYQACLGSYAGMIGFDMTPNYVDSSPTGIVVSPWCNCRGSGNMEEECEKFLQDFTENPCLRNAIQAFGNGTDVNVSPKGPSFQATQAPRVEKTPSLPDDLSDSTGLGTSVITTCTSVQAFVLQAQNPVTSQYYTALQAVGSEEQAVGHSCSTVAADLQVPSWRLTGELFHVLSLHLVPLLIGAEVLLSPLGSS